MFCSLDYRYVSASDIEASVRYYTDQLRGELVWKIHACNAWVAAVRLSLTRPLVLLADHLHGDTPILIYRVEHLETSVAACVRGGYRRTVRSRSRMTLATPFAIRREYDWPFTKTGGRK
jgi:hypothetical protein